MWVSARAREWHCLSPLFYPKFNQSSQSPLRHLMCVLRKRKGDTEILCLRLSSIHASSLPKSHLRAHKVITVWKETISVCTCVHCCVYVLPRSACRRLWQMSSLWRPEVLRYCCPWASVLLLTMTLWFQLYFPLLHSWRMCGVWRITLASFNTPPEEFHVLTTKQSSNFCPVVRVMLCHWVIVSQPGKMSMMHLLCVHTCVYLA